MDSGLVDELHSFVKIGDLALGARFLKAGVAGTAGRPGPIH
jgi:hypothetical protein